MYDIDVSRVIGIMSCKGGVGKTTTAVNLAVLLKKLTNGNVGIFDADLHGPNHSKMLGLSEKCISKEINNLNIDVHPKLCHGILSMSMSYFLKKGDPLLFRGPMISNIMSYLLRNTKWGKLDYLIIDFPPGSGDIYLNILKNIEFFGVYVITSSQSVSIQDTERSLSMLLKFNIPILGLLENMKYYICKKCNHKENFFISSDEINSLIKKFNIKHVYELPFSKDFIKSCDLGIPLPLMVTDDCITDVYSSIVKQISIVKY